MQLTPVQKLAVGVEGIEKVLPGAPLLKPAAGHLAEGALVGLRRQDLVRRICQGVEQAGVGVVDEEEPRAWVHGRFGGAGAALVPGGNSARKGMVSSRSGLYQALSSKRPMLKRIASVSSGNRSDPNSRSQKEKMVP